ncbi:MAG: DUF3090 family protein [Dehalococcoidia bacterium]|nr:DUF3090 family protein [Dehalococcoidia bacterium]
MSKQSRFIIDPTTRIYAGSEGQPGRRTFFLEASNDEYAVKLWFDKETMRSIYEAIDKAFHEADLTPKPEESPGSQISSFDAEFRSGRISMTQDEQRKTFTLMFSDAEGGERGPYRLRSVASYEKVAGLSEQMRRVYAAGRPTCPLCTGPMDPSGHICPRANGHRRIE